MDSISNPDLRQLEKQTQLTKKLLNHRRRESNILKKEQKNMEANREMIFESDEREQRLKSLKLIETAFLLLYFETNIKKLCSICRKRDLGLSEEEMTLIQLIEKFPEGSELHRIYVEQLRKITASRFEPGQSQKEKQAEEAEHETSGFKNSLKSDQQLTSEQKQLPEKKRPEKELTEQGPIKLILNTDSGSTTALLKHELIPNESGVVVSWDFLCGPFADKKYGQISAQCIDKKEEFMTQTFHSSSWKDISKGSENDQHIIILNEKVYYRDAVDVPPLVKCLFNVNLLGIG
ncbi:hypothetical protein RFI_08366 [Reticulomyxa filosa]|uniref:Uncharacterized protein n=1 Tax=Reticulomyxa filosa TaxID=46433 RepID=X6NR24_RETFI|nr:hypothetical protein RFI_08366 [Reticulomyxa filosa]|eukprot:ETO28760.1 hypothetical protein RFI_08366 [Reticulomyxa filosa]